MASRAEWIGDSRYVYNARAARYRDQRTGRFVSQATIRRVLDQRLDREARRVDELAQQLQQGQIPLREWQREMRASIKNVQLASAALSRGGWAQMTASDFGRVGQITRQQYAYLQRWAEQLSAGTAPRDGRLRVRAQMYAQAGRVSFHQVERAQMQRAGFDLEKNVRYAGDSCEGCVAATAAGWVPIGQLPAVGQRDCLSRCRCRLTYRRSDAQQEAA